MIRVGLIILVIIFFGCTDGWKFNEFTNEDSDKGEKEFLVDSETCTAEKDKFSHKIQGREFGFQGEHTGYLGCMKLKGWSQITR